MTRTRRGSGRQDRARLPDPGVVRWPMLGVSLLGLLSASVLVWGSLAPAGQPALQQLVAVLACAVLGGAAVLWVALDRRFSQVSLGWVFLIAVILRLIAIQAEPLLEDDYFRYLWDGWRTATERDPYRLAPSAFFGQNDLPSIWQKTLNGINYPEIPTIYGPALQWFFAAAYLLIPGDVFAVQALLMLADLLALYLLSRWGVARRGLLIYALHPLVLKEAMASAHPDGLVPLLLILSVMAWKARRALLTGALAGVAVCTKVAALVVLPMLFLPPARGVSSVAWIKEALRSRWPWLCAVGFALAVLVLYAPLLQTGGSEAGGLVAFGTEWLYNPLLFRVVELIVPFAYARGAAALMIVAAIAVLVWRWRTQPQAQAMSAPPLDMALLWLILLSPVVNPWYWLWLLPLSLMMGQGWLAVAASAMPVAYLNSAVLSEAGLFGFRFSDPQFVVQWPAVVAQFLVLALTWMARNRLRIDAKQPSDPLQTGETKVSTISP